MGVPLRAGWWGALGVKLRTYNPIERLWIPPVVFELRARIRVRLDRRVILVLIDECGSRARGPVKLAHFAIATHRV